MDTIFALASARGQAGVAAVRVSGPHAVAACEQIAGKLPAPGQNKLRTLRNPDGDILDRALVLRFAAGHSFTGEDVVEFQVHGSPAVIAAVLRCLGEHDGLRIAEPGEFTRRALENECLALTEIEGLSDLLVAETEVQRKQAMRLYGGALAEKGERLRVQLISALALLEVSIDFADEEVPVDIWPEFNRTLNLVKAELDQEITGIPFAERVRDGFEVALVGAPNVGKSTLFNYLAGREAAITSEIAGTTRDVVEVRMDLNGIPVTILDTAGLRDGQDEIEKIGIERSRQRIAGSDLRVFLLESDDFEPELVQDGDIVVTAKGDLKGKAENCVSGLTGAGVDNLLKNIVKILERRVAKVGAAVSERHRESISDGIFYIERALQLSSGSDVQHELVAVDVRSALAALDSLVGRTDIEHVLGAIFGRFCLGK